MRRISQFAEMLRVVRQDRRGVAAAEFAMIVPVFLIMLLATYDIGNYVLQQMQLQQALRAGGQYALSFPTQYSGMESAITAALPSGLQTTVTFPSSPTASCVCWSSGGSTPVACSASCASGTTKQSTLTLTAQLPYSPFMFATLGTTISGTYVVRFQ
jgi:Flp pilus assembly protein TadG